MSLLALVVAGAIEPSVGQGLALEWSAPPSCPDEASVRASIDENLGRDEFGPELDAVTVEGAIAAEAEGFRLTVSIALPSGTVTREVESRACEELSDAAGLIIAVVLDPLRVVKTVQVAPVEAASSEVPPALEPAPEPEAAPATRLHADLRVGGVLEVGSLPVVRGGVAFDAGLVGRLFRVDLSLHYLAPRRVRPFDAEPDAGVSVQQATAAVRGCVVPVLGPVELPTCAGLEAGASWARGIAIADRRWSTLPSVAVTLGEELSWISSARVGLWIRVDAVLNLVRPRFHIVDLGHAAETRWVGLRVMAGPAVRI